MSKKPVALIIMDGFGHNPSDYGNAIHAAKKPNLDKYMQGPNTLIGASGLDVGLPDGQMGNSEVGHTNIGAGRIVYQMLVKITKDIEDGKFFENPAISAAMDTCKEKGTALHLMGLLSPGGVHSHISHLYGLLEMAKQKGLSKVYVHAFLDGREEPPASAAGFMKEAVAKLNEIGVGKIATISGRYYAMDRDNAWDRVEKAYDAMVLGEGVQTTADPVKAIEDSYANDVTDEFMLPTVLEKDGTVKAGDSMVFFNFRPDRARELTHAFTDTEFQGFPRKEDQLPVHFVTMTEYEKGIQAPVAFPPEEIRDTLAEVVSKAGLHQLHIAETEKYAHVTFFFNGGREQPFPDEDRILVPSPKVATYDLQPEMSAYLVTEKLQEALDKDLYDLVILNFANPDMVGHTGSLEAAVKALEAVDECVGSLADKVLKKGGALCITADHGNLEEMEDPVTHAPMTAHTTNPVPFLVVGADPDTRVENGGLSDIAPTLLDLLDLPKPEAMTGHSLLMRK